MKDRGQQPSANRLQLAARIAQVPGQSISMCVEVATRARQIAVSRQARIVQKTPTLPHSLRLRIEPNRNARNFRACLYIDDAQRFIKAVEHVQPLPRFVDRQSRWTLPYVDPRLNRASRIQNTNLGRAGCGNIKRAVSAPRDVGR